MVAAALTNLVVTGDNVALVVIFNTDEFEDVTLTKGANVVVTKVVGRLLLLFTNAVLLGGRVVEILKGTLMALTHRQVWLEKVPGNAAYA